MKAPFEDIIKKAQRLNKRLVIPMCGKEYIEIIEQAAILGMIYPVFTGVLRPAYNNMPHDFIKASTPHEAVLKSLELLKNDKADILMQGGTSLDVFLNEVTDAKTGIRSHGHTSQACILKLPGRKKPVIITDTLIHEHPSINEKQAIIENAARLWSALGFNKPKTAALAVIEYVNPRIHSTVEAAVLSKMSERGQLGDVHVEGPLDIDCAVSKFAARRKGLDISVAGDTDIYLVHDAESGYLFAEHLVFIGRLHCSGIILGTSKPVIADMPFFSDHGRIASIAAAVLLSAKGDRNG